MAAGALLTVPLLNSQIIPESIGWRICFLLGAVLGIGILFVRRVLPESPRRLMTHGKAEAAEEIVHDIEQTVMEETGLQGLPAPKDFITVQTPVPATFVTVWQELLYSYPTRTLLGATLMATQSFLYNSIFFTYALILSKFYGIASSHVGLYLVPFAIGNFLGPLLLGRFFDSVGRRSMIAWTYGLS